MVARGRIAGGPARDDFPVFLGSKAQSTQLLQGLRGAWQDIDHPKIYTITVGDETANVLTDHWCGREQRGVCLIALRRVQDVYCIMWGETFCLAKSSDGSNVVWLPIDKDRHRRYRWKKL